MLCYFCSTKKQLFKVADVCMFWLRSCCRFVPLSLYDLMPCTEFSYVHKLYMYVCVLCVAVIVVTSLSSLFGLLFMWMRFRRRRVFGHCLLLVDLLIF